jgi:uncharacterized Zn finger protein (UPF0148 family)
MEEIYPIEQRYVVVNAENDAKKEDWMRQERAIESSNRITMENNKKVEKVRKLHNDALTKLRAMIQVLDIRQEVNGKKTLMEVWMYLQERAAKRPELERENEFDGNLSELVKLERIPLYDLKQIYEDFKLLNDGVIVVSRENNNKFVILTVCNTLQFANA